MNNTDAQSLRSILALSFVEGLGPVYFKRLVDFFGGDPAQVLDASYKELSFVGNVPVSVLEKINRKFIFEKADHEIFKAKQNNIRIFSYLDEEYPAALKQIYAAPPVLYVRGRMPKADTLCIGIVGSRKAGSYGCRMTTQIGGELSSAGVTIISGLARGIDTIAHEAAVNAKMPTIAVLGSGLLNVYPQENSGLAEKIVECGGALISEYPLESIPVAAHFPQRNRIISGLSRGVFVVEAGEKSGSLITVDFALEQGRDVFALAHNADYANAAGIFKLIKSGAKIVTAASDILEEYGLSSDIKTAPKNARSTVSANLSDEEKTLLGFFEGNMAHMDELLEKSEFSVSRIPSILLNLQMKGVLRELPGKNFEKLGY